MIRGAIDNVHPDKIGGWIFSEQGSLKGKRVLAFVDGQCVGAGDVGLYRQDLADAGMDEGFVGFNFDISLPSRDALPSVIVSLENSDLFLKQSNSIVVDAVASYAAPSPGDLPAAGHSPASIEWMQSTGWLSKADADFLKYLASVGFFTRSLRKGKTEVIPAEAEAERLFSIYNTRATKVTTRSINLSDLAAKRGELLADLAVPFIAISSASGIVRIAEGSNQADYARGSENLSALPANKCSLDMLIFLDLRSEFVCEGGRAARLFVVEA
ncbi:hypothetical protein ABI_20150 [Asticcacaulis biprosthecium C19]|uniref:Uncharacterized protein n=1 Tax=Asticcacaulis biprosthecium C19 TaxID=715226 RepID=F4QM03_9CAUL|nr:hypothetical protein [Asticcacaulis biprosthecium]EGF93575.1 hypothetical protein ABI_20150 [Asticcacaulis biprosthecium C19]